MVQVCSLSLDFVNFFACGDILEIRDGISKHITAEISSRQFVCRIHWEQDCITVLCSKCVQEKDGQFILIRREGIQKHRCLVIFFANPLKGNINAGYCKGIEPIL